MLIGPSLGLIASYPEELSKAELKQSRYFIFLKDKTKFKLYEGDLVIHDFVDYTHFELMSAINCKKGSSGAWRNPDRLFYNRSTGQRSEVHKVSYEDFIHSRMAHGALPEVLWDMVVSASDYAWRAAMVENVFIMRPNGECLTFYCGYPRQTQPPASLTNLRDTGAKIKLEVNISKGERVITWKKEEVVS